MATPTKSRPTPQPADTIISDIVIERREIIGRIVWDENGPMEMLDAAFDEARKYLRNNPAPVSLTFEAFGTRFGFTTEDIEAGFTVPISHSGKSPETDWERR